MMKAYVGRHLIFTAALIASCGGADFGGGPGAKTEVTKPGNSGEAEKLRAAQSDAGEENSQSQRTTAPENDANEADSVSPDEIPEILGNDPNGDAIASCLAKWGSNTGLTAAAVKKYRTLEANATGFSSSEIADRTQTKLPSLVLITSAATGFASIQMDLGNPNGFYCLKGKNIGFSGRKIMKHCRATIASDSVDNTGFSGSSTTDYGSDCG